MSKLLKLKIKWWSAGHEEEETTCDFEQAKDTIFSHGLEVLIFVEHQMITSYEGLVQLASEEQYKDKEFLEVVLVPTAIPGG